MKTTKQQRDKMRSTGIAPTPLDDVLDDLDELERTLDALASVVVCAYCDAPVMKDELREHEKVCALHPCRALEHELDKMRQYVGISVVGLPEPADPDQVMASVRDLAAVRRITASNSICVHKNGLHLPWEVFDAMFHGKAETLADALANFDEQQAAAQKPRADATEST